MPLSSTPGGTLLGGRRTRIQTHSRDRSRGRGSGSHPKLWQSTPPEHLRLPEHEHEQMQTGAWWPERSMRSSHERRGFASQRQNFGEEAICNPSIDGLRVPMHQTRTGAPAMLIVASSGQVLGKGLLWELNPGLLTPETRTIPKSLCRVCVPFFSLEFSGCLLWRAPSNLCWSSW